MAVSVRFVLHGVNAKIIALDSRNTEMFNIF